MDKELLRLVIIATGVAVMIIMLLWHVMKNRKSSKKMGFYDKEPLENIDESLVIKTGHDDFDIVPLGSPLEEEAFDDPISQAVAEESKRFSSHALPEIIQFSIVPLDDEQFKGDQIAELFGQLGLVYGDMNIFERMGETGLVDFAVASMVEPGIFPETNMDEFSTPGILFFMQTNAIENPLQVFDEMVQVMRHLEDQLNGLILDDRREQLTTDTLHSFREQLLAS